MKTPHASKARTAAGQQTAERILETTARLLADGEVEAVSLDRISEEVGVAKTSILWHFKSKKRLFLAVVDRVFDTFIKEFIAEHPDVGDVRAEVRLFLEAYAAFLRERPEINTILMGLIFDRKIGKDARGQIAVMYQTFRETVATHYTLDGEPFPPEVASAVIAFVDGVFIQWFIDPENVDVEAIFDAFLNTIMAPSSPTSP